MNVVAYNEAIYTYEDDVRMVADEDADKILKRATHTIKGGKVHPTSILAQKKLQATLNKHFRAMQGIVMDALSERIAKLAKYSEDQPRDEQGRFAPKEAAKIYVELHNQASKEYKQAFKDVGAKMWHSDDAHSLKSDNEKFIVSQMEGKTSAEVKQVYIISRPLTVLDSYPDVTASQRKKLNEKIKEIHSRYSEKWNDYLQGKTKKLAKSTEDDEILNDIFANLLAEWEALGKDVKPPLTEAALAGAALGNVQLEIGDADMLGQVNTVARDWAADRAAELVGMRRGARGKLEPNPDARFAISTTTRDELRSVITDIFEQEKVTLDEVEQSIEDAGIFDANRATMIARTEIARAQARGNLDSWRVSGLVKTVIWQMSSLHDQDDECNEAANGSPYALDEVPDFPAHPNCVIEGAVVSSPDGFKSAFKRRFEGEVVVLRSLDGDELTVTPNHPMLTQRGWLAAGQVKHEDKLVKCSFPDDFWSDPAAVDPQDELAPTVVEEVFSSLLKAAGVASSAVPSAPEYFHGDGAVDGEVHVVRSNRLLLNDFELERFENVEELELVAADVSRGQLSVQGALAKFSGAGLAPAASEISFTRLPLPLREGHLAGSHQAGGSASANLESVSPEPVDDVCVAGRKTFADLLSRFSRFVSFVPILNIERRQFSGQVYNLETASGYYIANGLVVHNCECSLILGDLEED